VEIAGRKSFAFPCISGTVTGSSLKQLKLTSVIFLSEIISTVNRTDVSTGQGVRNLHSKEITLTRFPGHLKFNVPRFINITITDNKVRTRSLEFR